MISPATITPSAIALLLLAASPLVSAHSFLSKPVSRQIRCKSEQWKNVPGGNCFRPEYDANAYGIQTGSKGYEDVLAGKYDGRLCNGLKPLSANGHHYEKFNDQIDSRNRYEFGSKIDVVTEVTAPHAGVIHYFLSKDDVYGKANLGINDFEELPGCELPIGLNAVTARSSCKLPPRATNRHTLIYVYYGSTTHEVFSSCADIELYGDSDTIPGEPVEELPVDDECDNKTVTRTHSVTVVSTEYVDTCTGVPDYENDDDMSRVCTAAPCNNNCVLEQVSADARNTVCLDGISISQCNGLVNSHSHTYVWCE